MSFLGLKQRGPSAQSMLEDGDGVDRHRSGGVGDMARFFKDLGTAPDRGRSFYQQERQRHHLAALVEAGRHAGRSRVEYMGRNIKYHLFTKDFFITMINQKTTTIMLVVAAVYLFVFFFYSIWWYLIVRFYPGCVYGATTYVECFTFAIITQMTIGYGNTGPQNCWAAAWLIAVQIITALLLESIVIGIVFARISHPKQRSRSIFISDSAVIARRDGILKFMFRVADIRRTQVVDPKIKAFMYTWGEGRITAEGERIPVRCEALDLGYIDGMLLLPLIIEHTIDERSPLCGHTHDSLMALNAEVVVTFEGTTEFGNPFMARRSYLPTEIHWGHQFSQIVLKPEAGSDDTHYVIDLNKFHDVVPQEGLPLLAPTQLSQLVVNRAKRTVPYPLLGDNTLVLSDMLCIAPNEHGVPALMCRAADTYPNQMLEITGRMYLYRWSRAPGGPSFTQHALDCGYRSGEDRLYLRLPVEISHPITEKSPIYKWLQPGGMMEDADSEIVVLINCYLHVNGQNRLRQRTYTVHNHVRYGYRFQNIVKHPAESRDRKPRVRWAHFHDIAPLSEEELGAMPPRTAVGLQPVPSQPNLPALYEKLPSMAPESHGAMRAQEQRLQWTHSSSATAEIDPASTVSGSLGDVPVRRRPNGQQLGLPPLPGRPPSQPGSGRLAPAYVPSAEEQRNDHTVLPIDLSRYAATAGNEGDSIPLGVVVAAPAARRSPLPTDFAQRLTDAWRHQEEVEDGEATPFLLFPEVASYALGTTDAGDSLPHPQALHPTLPGPDRFRVDENERNDYTVLPMDLSRYVAQVARCDTGTRRQTGPVTLGEASQLLAQLQREQQETTALAAAGAVPPRHAPAGESSFGDSGYATPASAPTTVSPEVVGLVPPQHASPAATPKLGAGGFSAGAAAAAAALGAAAAAAAVREQQAAQQEQQQASEPPPQQRQQQEEGQQPEQQQQPQAGDGEEAASQASSTIGSDESAATAGQRGTQPAAEQDEGHQLAPEQVAQLEKSIRRATSTWQLGDQPEEGQEAGADASGPIHFSKQESWQRERALKNLFTGGPDSPTADDSQGGSGRLSPVSGGGSGRLNPGLGGSSPLPEGSS